MYLLLLFKDMSRFLIIKDNALELDCIFILYLQLFILFPRYNILSTLQLRGCLHANETFHGKNHYQGYMAGNLHSTEIMPGNVYPLGQRVSKEILQQTNYCIK